VRWQPQFMLDIEFCSKTFNRWLMSGLDSIPYDQKKTLKSSCQRWIIWWSKLPIHFITNYRSENGEILRFYGNLLENATCRQWDRWIIPQKRTAPQYISLMATQRFGWSILKARDLPKHYHLSLNYKVKHGLQDLSHFFDKKSQDLTLQADLFQKSDSALLPLEWIKCKRYCAKRNDFSNGVIEVRLKGTFGRLLLQWHMQSFRTGKKKSPTL